MTSSDQLPCQPDHHVKNSSEGTMICTHFKFSNNSKFWRRHELEMKAATYCSFHIQGRSPDLFICLHKLMHPFLYLFGSCRSQTHFECPRLYLQAVSQRISPSSVVKTIHSSISMMKYRRLCRMVKLSRGQGIFTTPCFSANHRMAHKSLSKIDLHVCGTGFTTMVHEGSL